MWHISPSDTLDVDSVSGAALVKNTGTATVFHDIPGTGKTYREVFGTAQGEKTSLLLCTRAGYVFMLFYIKKRKPVSAFLSECFAYQNVQYVRRQAVLARGLKPSQQRGAEPLL